MPSTSIHYTEVSSPIGPLIVAASDSGLCHIEFGRFSDNEADLQKWSDRWFGTTEWEESGSKLTEAQNQLEQYFDGSRTTFDVPLDLRGTPFQVKVWRALTQVPYGQVCSYKDIGRAIQSEKAVRAVGGANNKNPVPIIVPCHRVIGADGSMVGYGGGLDVKTRLLRLEGYPI
ncbi:methylated-DNA--[protein]-cysteine S-methyltransferase [Paenibacillus sp. NPDC056579]|uniref:methylated-DNA--[protein]-cysteine S-methyltransferase n=1 Tax=Paenibacillus sp. NPDC056579 TaxID=3345871 RepID=UPI0036A87DF1